MKLIRALAFFLIVLAMAAFAGFGQAQTYFDEVQADNPLVHLQFGETSGTTALNAGSLGASHNATHNNQVSLSVPGPIINEVPNRAIRYNGSTGFSTLNSLLGSANFSDANYTVEMWFRSDTGAQPQDLLSITNAAGSGHGVLLETAAGEGLRYLHRSPVGGAGGQNIFSSQSFTTGQWHHLAIVNDSNAMRLYLDGNLDATTNTSSAALGIDLQTTIGRLSNTLNARHFDGGIDEVAIYDQALSAARIQAHVTAASTPSALFIKEDVLAVDFGATGQDVQSGFQEFSRATGAAGAQTEDYASSFAATGTDITVAIDNTAGFRDRGNGGGSLGDVAETFAFIDGELVLRLSNLAAGDYELTTYHHDTDNTQANVDVLVTDALGVDQIAASNILAGVGTGPLATSSMGESLITFSSNGVDDILFRFDESGAQPRAASVVVLNGFELRAVSAVPEPASVAIWSLIGIGLAGFGYYRVRLKK